MTSEAISAHLTWLWFGFSLSFVLLTSLWIFIEGPGINDRIPGGDGKRSIANSLVRVVIAIFIALGAMAGAGLDGVTGSFQWTAYTFWIGIVSGFGCVTLLFGDPRRWGDATSKSRNPGN